MPSMRLHHLLGGLGDEAELDELLDVLPDLAEGPGDLPVVVVHQPHVEPVLGERLRDALAHRARAHDQDLLGMRHSSPLCELANKHRKRVRIRSSLTISKGRAKVNVQTPTAVALYRPAPAGWIHARDTECLRVPPPR